MVGSSLYLQPSIAGYCYFTVVHSPSIAVLAFLLAVGRPMTFVTLCLWVFRGRSERVGGGRGFRSFKISDDVWRLEVRESLLSKR